MPGVRRSGMGREAGRVVAGGEVECTRRGPRRCASPLPRSRGAATPSDPAVSRRRRAAVGCLSAPRCRTRKSSGNTWRVRSRSRRRRRATSRAFPWRVPVAAEAESAPRDGADEHALVARAGERADGEQVRPRRRAGRRSSYAGGRSSSSRSDGVRPLITAAISRSERASPSRSIDGQK